jgi:hypothetical protein
VAGRGEDRPALAVPLERLAGAVKPISIHLDDEPSGGEGKVDLEARRARSRAAAPRGAARAHTIRRGLRHHPRLVAPDFLPPDPYAEGPRPNPPVPGRGKNNRAVTALGLGAAGLAVLVTTVGALFIVSLPASIAAWILGRQAQRHETGRDQARVAVTIGIVGTVLGVIAAIAWILTTALSDADEGAGSSVVRLAQALR